MKDGELSGAPSSQNWHCHSRAMATIPTVKGSALEGQGGGEEDG